MRTEARLIFKKIDKRVTTFLENIVLSRLFSRPQASSFPKNVSSLLILLDLYKLGEAVAAIPVIDIFKQRYPEAIVTVGASSTCIPLLISVPFSFEIQSVELKRPLSLLFFILRSWWRPYDCLMNTRRSSLTNWVYSCLIRARFKMCYQELPAIPKDPIYDRTVPCDLNRPIYERHENLAAALGLPAGRKWIPELLPLRDRLDFCECELRRYRIVPPLIGIHLGNAKKGLWGMENFSWLMGQFLKKTDVSLILMGGNREMSVGHHLINHFNNNKKVILWPTRDLATLTAVISKMALFIAPCTGPLHVAEAVGTPTLALCTPDQVGVWNPQGVNHRFVSSGVPSLSGVSPEIVFQTAEEMLTLRKKRHY